MLVQPSGGVRDFYTCGFSPAERKSIAQSPQGLGIWGLMDRTQGPFRVKDLATHSESVDIPASLRPMKGILEMPVCHRGEYVGHIYLVEKEGGQEFDEKDEGMAAVFAAHAASIISNSRRYEDARQARADMETLMDMCPIAVSVFDARLGEISYMNQESRRLLEGLTPSNDDLDNIFLSLKFTRPDGMELSFAELPGTRALQTGETVTAEEIVVYRADGTTLTTLVNCAPIFSASGEIVSVLTAMQDITPLEDQELRRAEFLGKVSEELRTPLAAIKGSATALRNIVEAMQPTEPMQLSRIIDQQADLMRSQINGLIELTQIETGTLSVVAEPADVTELIERSCGEYLREYAEIAIQLDIPEGLATVSADRERISKVLHNFLRQAAVHSSESSPVMVSATVADIYVAISVSVEGSSAPFGTTSFPVNAAEHPQLFKKVTQAHTNAVDLASKGEGLAMAFCRGVVEAHGGRIRTDVNEEEGRLTLTFTLPSVEEEIQTSAWQETPCDPMPAPVEKTQILVSIEDSRSLNTVRRVLLNAGYGTVAAYGLDEVEQLASSKRPKLILLDIAGRELDIAGREEECFRILRTARNSLNLPTIVLCDRDDAEYVVRVFDMGADGYMVKPFSPSELIARINATLRRLATGRELTSESTFQLGDMRIDFRERTVTVSGQPVQLTATEYKLLTEFSNSPGRVLTHDALLVRVWGPEYPGESDLLRPHIKSLRRKLGDNARNPSYIFTEHGIGYRMAKSHPTANRPGAVISRR